MSSIAGLEFLSWQGRLRAATRRYRLVVRAGVNGTGILWDAWRSEPATIRTAHLTLEDPGTIEESYRGLTTDVVTAVDDLGRTWNDVTVLAAPIEAYRTVADGFLIVTTWTLLPAAQAPA